MIVTRRLLRHNQTINLLKVVTSKGIVCISVVYVCIFINPRPAGVFGRTRPAGGGADSAPYLTPERMVVERREKRQTKALNNTYLQNTKNFT